jgi:integrase
MTLRGRAPRRLLDRPAAPRPILDEPSLAGMRPRTRSLAGVHPKVASEALGHSSVSFTMDTYQHVLPTMGEQVAQAIERALGSTR